MAKIGSLAVESSVWMNVNGVRTEFVIIHQGNPDPSLYDASCDGTWVMMKDIYESRQWHSSNSNAYANSTIHSYLNSTFLNLFEADIKAQIKQVKIPYVNGTGSSAVASGASGLSAKSFLLSGYEVGFTTSDSSYFPIDGAKLSYFENGTGTSALNKRIAYLNGSATFWWLRSPYTNYAVGAWIVSSDGIRGSYRCSNSYGVRPACILPSNLLVDDSSNVTAEEAPPPVQCRIPRKMTITIPVTVTISGKNTNSSITIGGVACSNGTTTAKKGDKVVITWTQGNTNNANKTKINLNGTNIAVVNDKVVTGTFWLTDSCSISIETLSNIVTITMPY